MYLSKIKLTNIRSIDDLEITFDEGKEPGWHVILGDNGSGKSTVIRSIALGIAGPDALVVLRQTWDKWQQKDKDYSKILLSFQPQEMTSTTIYSLMIQKIFQPLSEIKKTGFSYKINDEEVSFERRRVVNIFSASFGTMRHFSIGSRDSETSWDSIPWIANHLSGLGENISLSRGLYWLQTLHIEQLEAEKLEKKKLEFLGKILAFINASGLFPNGEIIHGVSSQDVFLKDANGKIISIHDMSDGFRSVASLLFELLAQMYLYFGEEKFLLYLNTKNGTIEAPAIVAIDEVDAHLHPTWQKEIGVWFTKTFPKTQFIVTTHSPIVCRAAANGGSIWRLPAPGTGEKAYRVKGAELNRVLYGDILDAFSTDLFGEDVSRSPEAARMLSRLAKLNMKNARGTITPEEKIELSELRATFPSSAPILSSPVSASDVEAAE
jgi:predicted ATPase